MGLRIGHAQQRLRHARQEVLAATASFVDNANYFTDGDDRPPFYGARYSPGLARRLPFQRRRTEVATRWPSADSATTTTVSCTSPRSDERFRLQFAVRTFQFSE